MPGKEEKKPCGRGERSRSGKREKSTMMMTKEPRKNRDYEMQPSQVRVRGGGEKRKRKKMAEDDFEKKRERKIGRMKNGGGCPKDGRSCI